MQYFVIAILLSGNRKPPSRNGSAYKFSATIFRLDRPNGFGHHPQAEGQNRMLGGNLIRLSEKFFDSVQKSHGIYAIMSLRFRFRKTGEGRRKTCNQSILAVFTFLPYFFRSLP